MWRIKGGQRRASDGKAPAMADSKRCRSGLTDGVPLFGSTKVDVVDRVEIHVLDVPCESGSPHAPVEVRCVDSRQLAFETEYGEDAIELSDVPVLGAIVKESAAEISAYMGGLPKLRLRQYSLSISRHTSGVQSEGDGRRGEAAFDESSCAVAASVEELGPLCGSGACPPEFSELLSRKCFLAPAISDSQKRAIHRVCVALASHSSSA